MQEIKNQPLFIIGAGRSGTNMLRDSICKLHGFETWSCDEINYIWRHGNLSKKDDEFGIKEATPEVKAYIRKQFHDFQNKSGAECVVEKTCASSLKVAFINEIFPDAKYIFIMREGRDVTSSAMKRWRAPLELKYILQKARFVPFSDLPYYGIRYFMNRIKKFFSKESRLAYWGPIYHSMLEDLKQESLEEVCARQWKNCVEKAYMELLKIDENKVLMYTYEDFVNNPQKGIRKLAGFLKIKVKEQEMELAINKVSNKSIGNHNSSLEGESLIKVNKIVDPVMEKIYNNLPRL